MDLRTRIVAAHANGEGGLTTLSRRFQVSISTVQRLLRRQKFHGHVAPSDAPNPILECWSKVKAILRRSKARTRDALVEVMGEALDAVTPKDSLGWFIHVKAIGSQ